MGKRQDPIFGLVAECDDEGCSECFGETSWDDDGEHFTEQLRLADWQDDEAGVFCPRHKDRGAEYDG